MTRAGRLSALAFALAFFLPAAAFGNDVLADPVLAVIGRSTVTLSTVESAAQGALRRVRNEEYSVRRDALEEILFQVMTDREAEARGIKAEELLDREVQKKVVPPTDRQKRELYDQNASRLGGKTFEEVEPMLAEHLGQAALAERQFAFLRGLKAKYGVRLFLEPPRVAVDPSDDPAKGPADAPVTLVIFSDFQCPFCAKAVDLVHRLEKLYGPRLRTVFRDYPLSMHKDAPRAAEAGACAADQGKFWRFHDELFARQRDLSDEGLKAVAGKAGLNGKAFAACLASGVNAEEWKQDAADGARYGVTGTPTFFINGRLLFGNQPFEALARAVDDELLYKSFTLPGAEKVGGKAGKTK